MFSTKRLKENNAARFSKSRIMVLYSGKNSFHCHETRPVKSAHSDVEFPSISQFTFAENNESGKLLNTSIIQLTTLSLSIHPSLWRVIFVPSISLAGRIRADTLILNPLASYFCADHI